MPTTAATLTRANFGELLTPVHRKVFFESYTEKPEQYSQIFKVDTMDRKEQTYPHMGAFGLWQQNTEGSAFNQSAIAQGNKATFTARRFDNSYTLTWELMQDDVNSVMRGAGVGGSARSLGRSLRATVEDDAVKVLTGGFANTGYDGVPLFSANHPLINSTAKGDNLVTGPLNDANLKTALTKLRNQVDEANVRIAANADTLFVSPDWEFTARALIGSMNQAGGSLNDINVLPNLNIVVLDFLGSSKIWGVQDSAFDNLMFLWRERAWFDSERLERSMDYNMFGYARWDCGYVDWRGIVASIGA